MGDKERPNVLLIMSDQHNKHISGCYGDTVIDTPNLDRLASKGVLFQNAYCNSPLCCPARMSFMTGRQPYEIQIWDNNSVLRSDIPTFAHALGSVGYETVLCGRMHFNGADQRHGFQRRIFPEVSGNAVGELVGTNSFKGLSFEKSGPGKNHYLLYDRECAEAGRQWLLERSGRAGSEKPFCLVVGLVGPHCPFVCPRDLFEKYFGAVSVPTYTEDYFQGLHPYSRRYRQRSEIENLTEHEIRRTRAAYFGMIEFDDRLVGGLLEVLEETGLAQNTVVIYTTDHGDLAGEHGMWWKMSFYEGSVGIPLIISWPGGFLEGRRERSLVSLADLAPTLTEIGGGPAIPGASGCSLLGLLRGEAGNRDNAVFSEMLPSPRWPTFGPAGGPARMVRKGSWKCNYYHGERLELFNLDEDPDEMVDRSRDPACGKIVDELLAEILADWDPEEVIAREKTNVAMKQFIRAAPADPSVLEDEYWRGPEGYGSVEPV